MSEARCEPEVPECTHQWQQSGGLYALQSGPILEIDVCPLCGAVRYTECGTAEIEPSEVHPFAVELVQGDRVIGRGWCATPVGTVRKYGLGRVLVAGEWRVLRADPGCGLGTVGEGDLAFYLPG